MLGCGQIYCFSCCQSYILLKSLDYSDLERCCLACVKRFGQLDYTKRISEFGTTSTSKHKVLIFGGELLTRKPLELLGEAIGEHYHCICFDNPGFGSRVHEKLNEESYCEMVKDAVTKYSKEGPVILIGVSMGGYGILKSLEKVKHRKIFGVLLLNVTKNLYNSSRLLLRGAGAIKYSLWPQNKHWKFVVEDDCKIEQSLLEQYFLSTPIDFGKWPECVSVMCANSADYYMDVLSKFKKPVLFIYSNSASKTEVEVLQSKCPMGSSKHIQGSKQFHCEPEKIPMILETLEKFITDANSNIALNLDLGYSDDE